MLDRFLLLPKSCFRQSEDTESFTEIRLLADDPFAFSTRGRERLASCRLVPSGPREKSITPTSWKRDIFGSTYIAVSSSHRSVRRYPITLTNRDIKPF